MIVDYGMINWGLYGVGYVYEILILLVVWGVGVRGFMVLIYSVDILDEICKWNFV